MATPDDRRCHQLARLRVRAAFFAAAERPAAPFVRTAFLAAADRDEDVRLRALVLACLDKDSCEAAE
jgi:hypothetical protein